MISFQHISQLQQLYRAKALGTEYVDDIKPFVPNISPDKISSKINNNSTHAEEKPSKHEAPLAETPLEGIDALHAVIRTCHLCDLCKSRTSIQSFTGNIHAKVMVISDYPSDAEDQHGPFHGKVGTTLKEMIEKVLHIAIEEIYYTHVIKCLPPQGREPQHEEIQTCLPFLQEQIAYVAPKLIIALGPLAYSAITHSMERFDQIRGIITPFRSAYLVALHHPRIAVRNPNSVKPQLFHDLKTIESFLCEH